MNLHVTQRNLRKIRDGNFKGMSLVDVSIELKEELLQALNTLDMAREAEEDLGEAQKVVRNRGRGRDRFDSNVSTELVKKKLPKNQADFIKLEAHIIELRESLPILEKEIMA